MVFHSDSWRTSRDMKKEEKSVVSASRTLSLKRSLRLSAADSAHTEHSNPAQALNLLLSHTKQALIYITSRFISTSANLLPKRVIKDTTFLITAG